LFTTLSSVGAVWSKGAVNQINTSTESKSSLSYSANGETYTWEGQNLLIDSFVYNGKTYNYEYEADNVSVKRVDNSVTTGERCALFLQGHTTPSNTMVPEYPRLEGTDNCDMGAVMGGNVINRGALDVFNNGGGGRIFSAKNIERVDFVFSGGITAPYEAAKLASTGVVATEKSGNNSFLVAAVLAIDPVSKEPTAYSKPIHVHDTTFSGDATRYAYGWTNVGYPMEFLNNEINAPQGYPYNEYGDAVPETMGMVFIDLEAFELSPGQVWYGFSYFSPDVGDESTPNALGQINWKAGIDPVNYAGFPLDTDHSYAYGDADLYGGVGGYFVDSELNNIFGVAYKDENKNNQKDGSESGIADLKVTLYKDNNGDGQQDGGDTEYPSLATDTNGRYVFVGVPDGQYIVRIDENDSDVPENYSLNRAKDYAVTVSGSDVVDIDFPFISSGTSPSYTIVGEFWFDDCGNGEWTKDYSATKNNATGTPAIRDTDYKDYSCNSIENNSWNTEIPDHAAYDITDGALSIFLYDHHNVWNTTRLVEKGYWSDSSKKLALEIKRADGDSDKGTITAFLNGNIIATGETYFTTYGGGDDDTQWIHILFSFGSQGMKLYINGDLKGTHTYTGGLEGIPSDIAMPAVSGYFDEFYILEGQPTDTEVTSIYNNLIANKNLDGSTRTCDCPGHKLEIVKTADKENVETGDTIVFTITVSNNSITTDATGVKVSDFLESTVTYVSDDSGGQYNASTGVWDIGQIDKETSKVLTITATVN
jgi:uncharacterized repeat protein (TIGR01451 family)